MKGDNTMGIRFLDHLLIMTHDLDATRDWFCKNLGFVDGEHPDFGFPVYWLYVGDQPVLHLTQARHSSQQSNFMRAPTDKEGEDFSAAGAMGSGRIDHFCLRCDDLKGMIERLTQNGVEFNERKANGSKMYQLFMREPVNGIKIELDFEWQEAVRLGRVPGWTTDGHNDKTAAEVEALSQHKKTLKKKEQTA